MQTDVKKEITAIIGLGNPGPRFAFTPPMQGLWW